MKSTRLGPTIISPGPSTQIRLLSQQTESSAAAVKSNMVRLAEIALKDSAVSIQTGYQMEEHDEISASFNSRPGCDIDLGDSYWDSCSVQFQDTSR